MILTLANGGPRAVDLRLEFGSASYGLRVPARDDIELQLPAEAVGALINQNQDAGLVYARNAPPGFAGLTYDLRNEK